MDLLHRFAQSPKPLWLRLILRRIVLMVLPKTVRFHGFKLAVNQKDHIMGSALMRGCYEPYSTQLFIETVLPGMLVVDCGANIGIYTCLASGGAGPLGKVYAFEPEPANFVCLTETIRLNQLANVQSERLALSDQNGETRLFLSDINMGDHRLGHANDTRRSVNITTRTLDSYWPGKIPHIDILKIDVQGAEGLVLAGMQETLRQSPNIKIFMEFWPQALRGCSTDPKQVLDQLINLGFSIQIVDQDRRCLEPVKNLERLLVPEGDETSFDLFLEKKTT